MEASSFGEQLRFWRTYRGMSQMKLATELNMSSRNLSFLETGRSRPTKPTIVKLTDYLEIPEQEKVKIFTAAGIRPSSPSQCESEVCLEPFKRAIDQLLENHNPYPALVFNEYWDLVKLNNSASMLLKGIEEGDNIVEKCFLNDQWIDKVKNSDEVLLSVFHEMRDDLLMNENERFLSLFRRVEKKILPYKDRFQKAKPAISFNYKDGDIDLNLISMITRFRSLNSNHHLRGVKVELIFPGDCESEKFLQSLLMNNIN